MVIEVTINEIKKKVNTSEEYDFLLKNNHLGSQLLCLGLGGSYAYGTSRSDSDIDIRGVALNSKEEILLGTDFEQVVDIQTDTTIYSLKKIFKLLAECNPNTIEILGLQDSQYIMTSDIWNKVRRNYSIFLSKKCIQTFGGYANAQLRRLETKSARETGQAQREKYIFGSIENAEQTFLSNYVRLPEDSLKLHIEESDKEDYDTEIMIDVNIHNYPLRDFASMINDYHAIIRGYDKIGKRNKKAIEHDKLGKHMAHLVRLYYMAFDILERGEIITYREKEHDLLMSIRNNEYLDGVVPKPEFYKLIDYLDKMFVKLKENTKLPDKPDYEAINKLLMEINNDVVVNNL